MHTGEFIADSLKVGEGTRSSWLEVLLGCFPTRVVSLSRTRPVEVRLQKQWAFSIPTNTVRIARLN